MERQKCSNVYVFHLYAQRNHSLIVAKDPAVLPRQQNFNNRGLLREEWKFPSSPATAKITKVGIQLHSDGLTRTQEIG